MVNMAFMKRVPKEEFLRDFEKYTEMMEKDSEGIVITENELDSLVVCPSRLIELPPYVF